MIKWIILAFVVLAILVLFLLLVPEPQDLAYGDDPGDRAKPSPAPADRGAE